MMVNKYVVLHSGDRIRMQVNVYVLDLEQSQQYCNDNIEDQLKHYMKDIRETASHIELIQCHKDRG